MIHDALWESIVETASTDYRAETGTGLGPN